MCRKLFAAILLSSISFHVGTGVLNKVLPSRWLKQPKVPMLPTFPMLVTDPANGQVWNCIGIAVAEEFIVAPQKCLAYDKTSKLVEILRGSEQPDIIDLATEELHKLEYQYADEDKCHVGKHLVLLKWPPSLDIPKFNFPKERKMAKGKDGFTFVPDKTNKKKLVARCVTVVEADKCTEAFHSKKPFDKEAMICVKGAQLPTVPGTPLFQEDKNTGKAILRGIFADSVKTFGAFVAIEPSTEEKFSETAEKCGITSIAPQLVEAQQ